MRELPSDSSERRLDMTPTVASSVFSINRQSTTSTNKLLADFAILSLTSLIISLGMGRAKAQSAPLPLGSVWNVSFLGTGTSGCPANRGFPTSQLGDNLNCYSATVSCPNNSTQGSTSPTRLLQAHVGRSSFSPERAEQMRRFRRQMATTTPKPSITSVTR